MKQQGFSDRDGMKGRKTCGIGKAGELLSFIEEAQPKKKKTQREGCGDVGMGCSFLHRGTEAPNP